MRFAYLILAHDNAMQLGALIAHLCPPGTPDLAFLHIDRKSPLTRDTQVLATANPAVRIVAPAVNVHWGHVSQLEAIRRLLRAALAEGFDLAHLISGADWPVAPRERIVAQAGNRCWIEAAPGKQVERMSQFRLDSRWLRPDPKRPFDWYRSRLLKAVSQRLPHRTTQPWGPWRKGSTWWSLPFDVCATVLKDLDQGFTQRRFQATVCADEHAIQTIVAHHHADRLAPDQLAPDQLGAHRRFMRWHGATASPHWLTAADWPAAQASGAWFARKLSSHHDPFFLTLPASFAKP